MKCNTAIFTVGDYLKGKVRNIEIPDTSLLSICGDAGVEPCTPFVELSQKQKDLATAWLYMWVAGSPTQSGGYTEESADWKSSRDSERLSAGVLKHYLDMARELFDKYGIDVVGDDTWGFVGRGIRNPRRRL